MYKIDEKSIKNLVEVNNLLNKLEIRGISNIEILYNCIYKIQETLKQIDEGGIVIDNSTNNRGG